MDALLQAKADPLIGSKPGDGAENGLNMIAICLHIGREDVLRLLLDAGAAHAEPLPREKEPCDSCKHNVISGQHNCEGASLQRFAGYEECLHLLLEKDHSDVVLLKCLTDMTVYNTVAAARVAVILLQMASIQTSKSAHTTRFSLLRAAGNSRSVTPLTQAVMYGNLRLVRVLLAAGANPYCAVEEEYAPIAIAKDKKDKECMALLLSPLARARASGDDRSC